MPQPERFDVVVLGSGTGGKLTAWHMAHMGQRTAGLHGFGRQAMTRDDAASDQLGRGNFHDGMGNSRSAMTERSKSPVVFAWSFIAAVNDRESACRRPSVRIPRFALAVSGGN